MPPAARSLLPSSALPAAAALGAWTRNPQTAGCAEMQRESATVVFNITDKTALAVCEVKTAPRKTHSPASALIAGPKGRGQCAYSPLLARQLAIAITCLQNGSTQGLKRFA